MTTTRRSLRELTVAQARRVSASLGLPVQRWTEADIVDLAPLALAEFHGTDPAIYDDWTVSALMAAVGFGEAEGEANGEQG